MGHSWDTCSWNLWRAACKETILHDVQTLHNQGEEENKDRKVEKSGGSLCFSTSVLRTLGDLVFVQVLLVGTGVGSGSNCQCGSAGKGEHKVHKVKDCKKERRCKEGDEKGSHTIETRGQDTKGRRKDTVRNLWVVAGNGGCS